MQTNNNSTNKPMISIIAAMTKQDKIIGNNNQLPWNIPEDLKNFKRITKNSIVIMGRKTYESIPKKFRPLPNRFNIILSRSWKSDEAITICRSPEAAMQKAVQISLSPNNQYQNMFIIGGAQIYKLLEPFATHMHISFIKHPYQGDTHFPQIPWEEYTQVNSNTFNEGQELTEFQLVEFEKKQCNNTQEGFTMQEEHNIQGNTNKKSTLQTQDPEIHNLIKQEEERQQVQLSMIASENFFSKAVREAQGSVLSHKYSEGNINRRYYEGNEFIDQIELLAIKRAKEAFNLPEDWNVNVQALSGSTANLSVYLALLNIGDFIMGMYLPDGGHLSHGWSYTPKKPADPKKSVYYGGTNKVNISSKIFNTISYKVDPNTKQFDYDEIERIATLQKPKLLITGGTAYPRNIDYKRMKQIADKVGAYYLADVAHEAGLVAAGAVPSPVGIADVVTLTTHKTLKSGRSALILGKADIIKKVNKAVLPGLLGGPFNHSIAAVAVGLKEVTSPEFKEYANQVIKNAKHIAQELQEKYDFNVVTNGTDKHLVLIDLRNKAVLGKRFAKALNYAGIVCNYNTIPGDSNPPTNPSGLRIGTAWLTTRGMKEEQMTQIARLYHQVMQIVSEEKYTQIQKFKDFKPEIKQDQRITQIANKVKELCLQFPLDI